MSDELLRANENGDRIELADRAAYEAYVRRVNGNDVSEAFIARLHDGGLDGNHGVQIARTARLAERERCAAIADERAKGRERLYEENGASINAHRAVEAEEIATAIRTAPTHVQ